MANISVATSPWVNPLAVAWIGAKPAIIIDSPPTASMPATPTGEIAQARAKATEARSGGGGGGNRVRPTGRIDNAVKAMPISGIAAPEISRSPMVQEPMPRPTM